MFPPDVAQWLNANLTAGYAKHLAASFNETTRTLASLGVSADSELGHLYLHYGPSSVTGWYDLIEIDEVAGCTEYAEVELGTPRGFLALSSAEGQGIVMYEKSTGAVFDVEFEQLDQLVSGELPPIAPTVVEFLRWCKARAR